jgi:BlaI family transcriptional regulator, penicillinase repressor
MPEPLLKLFLRSQVNDLPTPTAREMEILKVLWEHGSKSVSDVHRLIRTADGKSQHLNTIQTLLRLMETKGLVDHATVGRTFIYQPLFSRDETAARFLDRVFDGAASALVMSLIKSEKVSAEELAEMRKMIASVSHKAGAKP